MDNDYDASIVIGDDHVTMGGHEIKRPDGVTPENFRKLWDFARERWNARGSLRNPSDRAMSPLETFHRMVAEENRQNEEIRKKRLDED